MTSENIYNESEVKHTLEKLGFKLLKGQNEYGVFYVIANSNGNIVGTYRMSLPDVVDFICGCLLRKSEENYGISSAKLRQYVSSVCKNDSSMKELDTHNGLWNILKRINDIKITDRMTKHINQVLDAAQINLEDDFDKILDSISEHWNDYDDAQRAEIAALFSGGGSIQTFYGLMAE